MERKPLSSPLSGFLIYAIRHRGDAYEHIQMFRECSTDAQEHESLVEIKNRARWSICNTIRK